jgi:carbon-monoxide dehydrogenase medium subunit/xanthine dehydrogenase FAD-binding subunit
VPVLLNFDAEVTLISKNGERRVKLGEFTNGPYSTIIRGDELLYSLECRLPVSGAGFAYIKLGRRRAVNISRMTLAAVVIRDGSGPIDQSRISAGSVFPTPARINEVENLLIGQKPCAKLFQEAGRLAADLMIARSGRRWSTPYKMPVLRGLLERALRQAAHLGMDRS